MIGQDGVIAEGTIHSIIGETIKITDPVRGEVTVQMPPRSFPGRFRVVAEFDSPQPVTAAPEPVKDTEPETNRKTGAHRALMTMLAVLDGWIQGQQDNHEASGHRGEGRGAECWRLWAPDDIRRMVNDAAREVGLAEFDLPEEPVEDRKL